MIVVIEGIAHCGVEATAQEVAEEIQASHLALYEGPWKELTLEGHLMADELALQIALGLDADVVLERSLPTTWIYTQIKDTGINPFRIAYLDHLFAEQEHLGVLVRPTTFEEWLELGGDSLPPASENGKEIYDKFTSLYQSYIKGSQMDWIICDPYPPVEKIVRHLGREK